MATINELQDLLDTQARGDVPTVLPEPRILTIPRGPRFVTSYIPPEASLYINSDEHLAVHVWNSKVGATLFVQIRLLRTDGELVYIEREVKPSSDRLENTFVVPLSEGFLISVTLDDALNNLKRGECYASIRLLRSLFGPARYSQILVSGYVSQAVSLGVPHGRSESPTDGQGLIKTVTMEKDRVDGVVKATVPTSSRWRLLAVRIDVTPFVGTGVSFPSMSVTNPNNQLTHIIRGPRTIVEGVLHSLMWMPVSQSLPLLNVPGSQTGEIITQALPNPPAGSENIFTVSNKARVRILSLHFVLTTSSAAGTRQVFIDIDDGVTRFAAIFAPGTQGPSTANRYTFAPAGLEYTVRQNNHLAVLPSPLVLPFGYRLRVRVSGMQSGDQLSEIAVVYERQWDSVMVLPLPDELTLQANSIVSVFFSNTGIDAVSFALVLVEEHLDI